MPFVSGMGYRRWALALVVGMLLISGVLGWLLPYPIHDQLVYGLLFGSIWVFRFQVIREAVRRLVAGWREAVRSEPRAAFFCATVLLLGSMALWVPTVQFDDLAGHLAIPFQLRELGYYRLDAASQVWAMTPWTPDVLQAIVGVLAGSDARGPVNGIWYALGAYFLWDICRSLELPRALRWLVAAAFASQPLVLALLGGMQVEIVLTALSAAVISVVLHTKRKGNSLPLAPVILICAGLLAVKATQVLLVLPVAVWALWGRRIGRELMVFVKFLPIVLLITGSSYFYAALITGNPVLPIFNDIFRSPYYSIHRFNDAHWHAGLTWSLPWQLTFDTDRYMESYDGSAGFLFLGLLGGCLLALNTRRAAPAIVVIGISMLGTLYSIQYLRYVFPALTLIIPLSVAGCYFFLRRQRELVLVLGVLIIANLGFYPNSFYRYQNSLFWDLFSFKQQAKRIDVEFAPEKEMARYLRYHGNGGGVLLAEPGRPYMTAFSGKAISPIWYDPTMLDAVNKANEDTRGELWVRLINYAGIGYVISKGAPESQALSAAFKTLGAVPVLQITDVTLWAVQSGAVTVRPTLANTRDYARQQLWPGWLRFQHGAQ